MNVEMPDGTIIEGVPDGTTRAAVLAKWRSAGGREPVAAVDPMEGMPGWQRALVGIGAEMTDWGQGLKEAVARPLNAAGIVSNETMAGIDADRAAKREIDKRLDSDIGANVGRFTAAAATGMGVPTATVRGAFALGSVLGALAPTDNEQQRLASMLLSGTMGAAGQAVGNKIAAWLSGKAKAPALSSDEVAVIQQAQQRGYDLTPAQMTKSRTLDAIETQLASQPGSAGDMAARRGAQRERFNADLFGTMGEAPRGSVAPGTVDDIKAAFAGKYAKATAGVDLTQDAKLVDDLVGVQTRYERNLSPDQRAIVRQYIDDIPAAFDGQAYQTWRSRIGARAAGTADSELKAALKGIQKALDDAFDRQAPAGAKAAMARTRGEYRNFKTLRPLIAQAEARGEDIRPMMLAQRVAGEDNLSGELGDLARIGRVIGREGPNSGTAQNLWAQRLVTGSLPLGGALGGYYLGQSPEAAVAGGAGTLAATLLAPKVASSVYLSRALRDAAERSATGAARAAAAPSALRNAMQQLGIEGEPAIEALTRGGMLGLPALLGQE